MSFGDLTFFNNLKCEMSPGEYDAHFTGIVAIYFKSLNGKRKYLLPILNYLRATIYFGCINQESVMWFWWITAKNKFSWSSVSKLKEWQMVEMTKFVWWTGTHVIQIFTKAVVPMLYCILIVINMLFLTLLLYIYVTRYVSICTNNQGPTNNNKADKNISRDPLGCVNSEKLHTLDTS